MNEPHTGMPPQGQPPFPGQPPVGQPPAGQPSTQPPMPTYAPQQHRTQPPIPPGYGQSNAGQPPVGQGAYYPYPGTPQPPQEPVFCKNALVLGGATVGLFVGASLIGALIMAFLMTQGVAKALYNLPIHMNMFGRLPSGQGVYVFFAALEASIAWLFGAGYGLSEDHMLALFFLTMTLIVFSVTALLIRKIAKTRPMKRPLDLLVSSLIPGFITGLLLVIIEAIVQAIATSGDSMMKLITFSWPTLLFTAWFWVALVSCLAQNPFQFGKTPITQARLQQARAMIMPSLGAYGVATLIAFILLVINLIVVMVQTGTASFGTNLVLLIIVLGHLLVAAPIVMLGGPIGMGGEMQASMYSNATVTTILLMVLATLLMALITPIALAIMRKGRESFADLGVIAALWFCIGLLSMWLTGIRIQDSSLGLGGVGLLYILLLAVVVDLLARFAVPYVAQLIPALGRKYPYLLENTQAQKLFGAPAPSQVQWGNQQGYPGYPGQAVPGQPMPGYPGYPQAGQGFPGQGMPGQGVPGQGMPGQPAAGYYAPGQYAPGQPGAGQGAAGQGFPGQGVPGQGVAGQGMPSQGAAGQGVPGQGAAGQGFPGQPASAQYAQGQYPSDQNPSGQHPGGQYPQGQPAPGQPIQGQPAPGQPAFPPQPHFGQHETAPFPADQPPVTGPIPTQPPATPGYPPQVPPQG